MNQDLHFTDLATLAREINRQAIDLDSKAFPRDLEDTPTKSLLLEYYEHLCQVPLRPSVLAGGVQRLCRLTAFYCDIAAGRVGWSKRLLEGQKRGTLDLKKKLLDVIEEDIRMVATSTTDTIVENNNKGAERVTRKIYQYTEAVVKETVKNFTSHTNFEIAPDWQKTTVNTLEDAFGRTSTEKAFHDAEYQRLVMVALNEFFGFHLELRREGLGVSGLMESELVWFYENVAESHREGRELELAHGHGRLGRRIGRVYYGSTHAGAW